jgi:hypothetical protein
MLWIIVFVCGIIKIVNHSNQLRSTSPSIDILNSQSKWRYREDELDHQILESTILLPARSSNPALGKLVELPIPNPHGSGVKLYVKAMVKDHPLYNHPVTTDPPISGWSYKGEPIPIDTLGLWIFGTTGYDGNVRFSPDEGRVRIQVPLESPDEIEVLLRSFYKPNQTPEPSVSEDTEASFSPGLVSSVPGSEAVLNTEVKNWIRNRQVNKLR